MCGAYRWDGYGFQFHKGTIKTGVENVEAQTAHISIP